VHVTIGNLESPFEGRSPPRARAERHIEIRAQAACGSVAHRFDARIAEVERPPDARIERLEQRLFCREEKRHRGFPIDAGIDDRRLELGARGNPSRDL